MEVRNEKKKSKKLSINLTNCKYDVVRDETRKFGMSVTEDPSEWSLFWIDTGVSYERVLEMYTFLTRKSYQRINHFPGMHEICRKDQLARKVARLNRVFPKDYNFFPTSWIMPTDWLEFQRQHKPKKGQCYISKPDHGCQGKGIFLFKDPEDIADHKRTEIVVQNYISNPCLVDGFKFDFRVYVLVTSVNPLRIFVYDDGLARFATELYHPPSDKNLEKICMHLTNYAVNKNSKGFVRDEERGSKRTIKNVLEELRETKGLNSDVVWKRIQDVIVKTVLLVQPQLSKLMKPWFPTDENASLNHAGSQCFEILGFDVMLDNRMKPWVLEVNHSPSFTCDSPLDLEMKSGVIQEALQLVNLNSSSQKKYQKDQKLKSLSRLFKSKASEVPQDKSKSSEPQKVEREDSNATVVEEQEAATNYSHLIDDYHKKYHPKLLDKLSAWEDARCKKYQRVFPPDDPVKLGKYLALMQDTSEWSTQTNTLKARKKYLETKVEQETAKNKRLELWKQKQQKKNIQPRVSFSPQDQHKIKEEILHFKRTVSPSPTVTSRAPLIREKKTIPLKVQTLNDHFSIRQQSFLPTAVISMSLYNDPLPDYTELMTTHPLIRQKQFELNQINSYVNHRKKK